MPDVQALVNFLVNALVITPVTSLVVFPVLKVKDQPRTSDSASLATSLIATVTQRTASPVWSVIEDTG